ncbi:carboxypeptidase-like regulatory domain-containing protein [Changchengzhania lutea]|uniref:carboxypeptidase-like regulatory domain-containing protein n=1 Tax=Changchengzhania lutea TaxID=2049305 RepID=UPI001FE40DCE|nr:carboxypeptidase-like regulatory domain-containing protein [Changchengzhania lutea]
MKQKLLILIMSLYSIVSLAQNKEPIDNENTLFQSINISGHIQSNGDIENVHVINKTAQIFTVSNGKGFFEISGKISDTLVFSSVQYQLKEIIIDSRIYQSGICNVSLQDKVNELDEVIVGKILTGNLMSDIKNTEGDPPINFYDVGIPGYAGKIATQSERRLNEATTGAGIIPLNPIINAITGRTKMLKNHIEIERREALMQNIKARLSNDFFASNPMDEDLRMDFFYFCADDENFIKHCKSQTDFKILIFLRQKYRQYIKNLTSTED